jgi:hypothetical protein
LLEAAQDVGAFVYDTCIDPGWGEASKVSSFSTFVDAVFLALLFCEEDFPAWVDFFEDRQRFF